MLKKFNNIINNNYNNYNNNIYANSESHSGSITETFLI